MILDLEILWVWGLFIGITIFVIGALIGCFYQALYGTITVRNYYRLWYEDKSVAKKKRKSTD